MKKKCVLNHCGDGYITQVTTAVTLIKINLNALSHK